MNNANVNGNVTPAMIAGVYRLLNTPAGSVPFDRNFGVDTASIDNTPAAIEGALLVEYTRKIKMYFPTITITDITFLITNNVITPKVVINYV